MKSCFAIALAALLACAPASAQDPEKESKPMHAQGTFEVKATPQAPDNDPAKAGGTMRLSLDKTFHGALEASGQGEMLADGDGGQKNGAYVAVEKISGTLDGRKGSFVLVHRALMRDGKPEQWTVVVSPGSGAGELAGIDGAMTIVIDNGVHRYDFDYTLPETPRDAN